jgi:hypothetical protein
MSNAIANSKAAPIKLSDAQLSMLRAAAKRGDGCLTPPASLRGAQIAKAGEKLIAAGLVREVKAKAAAPVWRRDGETGAAFALKLTAAGAKAIVVNEGAASVGAFAGECDAKLESTQESQRVSPECTQTAALSPTKQARAKGEPRATSKIAAVIGLLVRTDGATLAELIAATGWLPHTTRAALTGLRKRGYVLALDRSDHERSSVYRVVSRPEGDASGTSESTPEAA